MMRKWKFGLCLMVLPYCVPVAVADTAASGVAAASEVFEVSPFAIYNPSAEHIAAAIKAGTATAEQYFDAADAADKADDMITATQLYRAAADRGHAIAQSRIAAILYDSSYVEKALEFYRKAAEQGNGDGMYGVGIIAMGGETGKKDFAEARKWFTRAAEQGHVPSLQKLADAYRNGGLGLDEDARSGPEALSWIKRAADVDYIPAVRALADAYRSGQYGLVADPKQAADLDAKVRRLEGRKEVKEKKKRR